MQDSQQQTVTNLTIRKPAATLEISGRSRVVVLGLRVANTDISKRGVKRVREDRRKNALVLTVEISHDRQEFEERAVGGLPLRWIGKGARQCEVDSFHDDGPDGFKYSLSNLCNVLHGCRPVGNEVFVRQHGGPRGGEPTIVRQAGV